MLTNWIASIQQGGSKGVASILVRYLFSTCSVLVRYMSGALPNIYRSYSVDIADKDRRYYKARLWLEYGKSGDKDERFMRKQ